MSVAWSQVGVIFCEQREQNIYLENVSSDVKFKKSVYNPQKGWTRDEIQAQKSEIFRCWLLPY